MPPAWRWPTGPCGWATWNSRSRCAKGHRQPERQDRPGNVICVCNRGDEPHERDYRDRDGPVVTDDEVVPELPELRYPLHAATTDAPCSARRSTATSPKETTATKA